MNQLQDNRTDKLLYFLIGIAVLVNFSALFIPILGPDGTLYAMISKTMVQRNDYVRLFVFGTDWLDKPHFPFWVVALSFKLFGFTTWAYKLPGLLFMMAGAVYTYHFAKVLYNKQTALWSVLILLTAQHIILSNNDVRAEPFLTGLVIASVYHLYQAYIRNNFWHLLIGSIFTACAVMTKGMFVLVPIGGAIAGHLIITRQWKQLFSLRWLLAGALIILFTLPEIYCLYEQFDAHPEKVMWGQKSVSGIRFFFWDSQFGRFFNTGPIKGHGDPAFFIHTTLWAFLPWSLIWFAAIYRSIKTGIKNALNHEWLCISGALLTFILFSASKFQLPHYLNIVFPFFAIITAQYLIGLRSLKTIRTINIMQGVLIGLLLLIIAVLHYFFRPQPFSWHVAVTLLIWLAMLFILPGNFGKDDFQRAAVRSVVAAFVVNLYLTLAFYPSLLKYQAGSEAAMWINKHNPQNLPIVMARENASHPFEFYIAKPLIVSNEDGTGKLPAKPYLFYAPADVCASLAARGNHVEVLANFQRYWISRLKPSFLNRSTRNKELTLMQVVVVR